MRQLTPYAVMFRYDEVPEDEMGAPDWQVIRKQMRELRAWVEGVLARGG